MDPPLTTPTRFSSWSVEATTLRSTPMTSTTGAFAIDSVRCGGAGVRSMVAVSTRGGSIVFHGFSPFFAWAV